MTRQVPVDAPLSDEDREYLHARGMHSTVEMLDNRFGSEDVDALGDDVADDDPMYESWLKAELEAELAKRRLSTSGTNDQKAARLREDDAKAQP